MASTASVDQALQSGRRFQEAKLFIELSEVAVGLSPPVTQSIAGQVLTSVLNLLMSYGVECNIVRNL